MSILENSIIVLHQILIMFLLMVVGYILFKTGIFDNHTTTHLSTLLNTIVIPCCALASFNRDFDPALAGTLGLTMLSACGVFVVSIALSNALYRKGHPENYRDCRMCAVFSNNGFMSLPLLSAMFGETGVFLGSAHIVVMAVVLWTYGVMQVNRDYRFSPMRILLNPGIIAAVLGMLLFLSPVNLPTDVSSALTHITNLNTPLAMLVLGGYLAQTNLASCFTEARIWRVGAVRLLIIPALTMALLYFMPLDNTAKLTLLVGTSAPTAIASAMFAQMYGSDYLYSTKVVALTTILSLFTLPAVIAAMSFLLA